MCSYFCLAAAVCFHVWVATPRVSLSPSRVYLSLSRPSVSLPSVSLVSVIMGKQHLEHSLPALIQSMLWHFRQTCASRRPSIKQPSSTVLMAASEAAATITVLPAPQESQPNYEEVPHGAKGNFSLFPVSKFPAPREKSLFPP
jgi:hypothetical protein